MIIVTQTAYATAQLLLSSFIAGIGLLILYTIGGLLPRIALSFKSLRVGYRCFADSVRYQVCGKICGFLIDLFLCIVAASALCSLVFVYNNGQFRALAAVAMLLGFIWSRAMITKPLSCLATVVSFAVLKVILTVSLPLLWLIRLISRIIEAISRRYKLAVMKRYTKKQFDKLKSLTEFGLIEEYYKELIK